MAKKNKELLYAGIGMWSLAVGSYLYELNLMIIAFFVLIGVGLMSEFFLPKKPH